MTIARSHQININATPYYHCVARCIRHQYLCGKDNQTKKDYSHRKEWIVNRLKYLANVFAIEICAYAVMSNHYHLVLFVEEDAATQWSDELVISKWSAIYPKDAKNNQHNKAKIALWRERLTSISWFMRCLNYPIAKAANDEEKCSGKFWDGRFKSQALLDEGALLSAMVYVDLNPIRAGINQTPEESEFTSIYDRIKLVKMQLKQKSFARLKKSNVKPDNIDNLKQPNSLVPFMFNSKSDQHSIPFKLSDYLDLVDYSGRIIRNDKRGAISNNLIPILQRLQLSDISWSLLISQFESNFFHAAGSEAYLIRFGAKRQRSVKGIEASRKIYI